jgi:hypothetical protein
MRFIASTSSEESRSSDFVKRGRRLVNLRLRVRTRLAAEPDTPPRTNLVLGGRRFVADSVDIDRLGLARPMGFDLACPLRFAYEDFSRRGGT